MKEWGEVERLCVLDKLEELLLIGNPLYNEYKESGNTAQYRIEVGVGGAGSEGGHARSSSIVH